MDYTQYAPWSMTEWGEWELNEPFKSEVERIKKAATDGFNEVLFEELVKVSPYTAAQLETEYIRRCVAKKQVGTDLVTSYIVEAMTGQLYS